MKKITKEIKEFCKNNKITEKQFFGEEKIEGSLDWWELKSLPEGFNPVVGGYLNLSNLTHLPKGFNPSVGDSLNLRSLTSLSDGFNPNVGGDLHLPKVTSLPSDFNPVVGGDLCLRNLTHLPDGFSPVVGGILYLNSLTSLPDGFNPTVGVNLDLRNLTHLPEGFNIVVGFNLYLWSLTSLPAGFNPIVGGCLLLDSLTSLPDGFNPTVGGNLYLKSLTNLPEDFCPFVGLSVYLKNDKIAINSKTKKIIEFKGGKYIKCDGIFTEVVSRKKNIYKVKKINQEKEFFLIVEGEFSAHGQTLKEAKKDLEFKILQDRIKKEPIYPDTIINIDRYRTITGACTHGVQMWLQENKITEKEMKAQDLFPLLQETNAFGFDSFSKLYVNKTSII